MPVHQDDPDIASAKTAKSASSTGIVAVQIKRRTLERHGLDAKAALRRCEVLNVDVAIARCVTRRTVNELGLAED